MSELFDYIIPLVCNTLWNDPMNKKQCRVAVRNRACIKNNTEISLIKKALRKKKHINWLWRIQRLRAIRIFRLLADCSSFLWPGYWPWATAYSQRSSPMRKREWDFQPSMQQEFRGSMSASKCCGGKDFAIRSPISKQRFTTFESITHVLKLLNRGCGSG